MKVCFLNGINNNGTVEILSMENNYLLYNTGGSANIGGAMERFERIQHTIHHTNIGIPSDVDVIFNEIGDFDSHSVAIQLFLDNKDKYNVPVINNPANIHRTTREAIYKNLKNDNLIVPKTIKVEKKDYGKLLPMIKSYEFNFPILIRECGSHASQKCIKVDSMDDFFDNYCEIISYDNLYVSEFIDFKNTDGKTYTKYRVVVIGGESILRHAITTDSWEIHSKDRDKMASVEMAERYEKSLIQSRSLEEVCSSVFKYIYDTLELDYFGIDFGLLDDKIVLFEVNPSMNVLYDNVDKAYLSNRVVLLKEKIEDMIIDFKEEL